jgi:hypothetical protein
MDVRDILFAASTPARAAIQHIGRAKRQPEVTTAEDIIGFAISAGLTLLRQESILVLREFSDGELGRYITGRRGHPTRIEWHPARLAEAVDLIEDVQEQLEPQSRRNGPSAQIGHSASTDKTIGTSFPLRPDCVVEITIPANLRRSETQRIARWVETLWFVDDGPSPGRSQQ